MLDNPFSYKPLVSVTDETFDEQRVSEYHLSIEVASNGLNYAVLDTARNKYLLFESYSFQKTFSSELLVKEIKSLFEYKSILRKKYKRVSVCLFSQKFTLIPTALYDAGLTDKYLEFNAPLLENETILCDTVKNFETQCVYAIDTNLLTCVQELFPSALLLHTFTPLLEMLSSNFKNVSGKNVIIHLQQAHFEMIVLEEKKLIFANIFSYQTSEDFLYFTLFVCEQLKLNPENLDLLLLGEVEKNSAIYSILSKFVRHVKFGIRPEQFEYSYVFDSSPTHFYFNLFSQAMCV